METKNILAHIKKAVKITKYTAYGLWLYCMLGLAAPQYIVDSRSPIIPTQSKLEQLVEQERKKIDPSNNSVIRARLEPESNLSSSKKLDDGTYDIILGSTGANIATLQHELYHILDGHCDAIKETSSGTARIIKYLFWHEPQATIYQVTGLKP